MIAKPEVTSIDTERAEHLIALAKAKAQAVQSLERSDSARLAKALAMIKLCEKKLKELKEEDNFTFQAEI